MMMKNQIKRLRMRTQSEVRTIPRSKKPPKMNFMANFVSDWQAHPTNSSLSISRVRVFYKGRNRNGSFINEEVAQQIIDSSPGTPVVGYFDKEAMDFGQHYNVEETRAYGFIPPEPNFAWEEYTDDDGEARLYATFDVWLWTGRYEEARLIPEKGQSMELNPQLTMKGEWQTIDGELTYMFTKGELIGLCILGDDFEPCFEGAAFYSLNSPEFSAIVSTLKEEVKANFEKNEVPDITPEPEDGGKDVMVNFNLPEGSPYLTLWYKLNSDFTEEKGYIISYVIAALGETELYAYSPTKAQMYKFSIGEDGELGEPVESKTFTDYEVELATNVEKFTTLEAEKAELETRLGQYKEQEDARIAAEKDAEIEKYTEVLDEETIAKADEQKGNFTLEQLQAFLAKAHSASMFTTNKQEIRLRNNEDDFSVEERATRMLENYAKKKEGE